MAKRFDDDFVGGFQKIKSHKSNKHKGHQSKRGLGEAEHWNRMMGAEEDMGVNTTHGDIPQKTTPNLYGQPSIPSTAKPMTATDTPRGHTFGPNTRTIKSVQIDMDGVASMEKIENEKNGMMTYGIKFIFKGKKELFRIVWFNTNKVVRNATFETEYAFWQGLSH